MARKTRTPKIVAPSEPALPEPRYCQYPPGCHLAARPFASLTFKSKAGMGWTQSACQAHQAATVDYYRKLAAEGPDGGELVSVRLLGSEAAS